MPSFIVRRRCFPLGAGGAGLVALWLLVVIVAPLAISRFVFRFRSLYFYAPYVAIITLITYVTFTEKALAHPLPPQQHPPPPDPRHTVDVEMPIFDYRRCGALDDDVEGGCAEKCVICLCDYGEGEETAVSLPTCQHNFHVECIRKWLQRHGRCPICSSSPFPKVGAEPISRSRAGVVSISVVVGSLLAEGHRGEGGGLV